LIVWNTTAEELGIYSLVIAVAGVLSALAFLGLQEGSTRYISIYLGNGKGDEVEMVSRSSIQICVISGIVTFVLLYVFSDDLAQYVFYKRELSFPFKVISFSIPFMVVSGILVSIMRGHGMIRPRVFYQDIGTPLYFLLFLGAALLMEFSFMGIIYAYTISMAMVFISVSAYGYKKIGLIPLPLKKSRFYIKLLGFSLPLIFTGIAYMVLTWTDTLMLGRYTTSEEVGIYNVSLSLAKLLPIPFMALSFVFLPLAGEMYGRKQHAELKRTYQVLTKWIFSITFPMFFILFFFPEMTITSLFGDGFVASALPLQIIVVGFLFQAFLGANSTLLIALGLSKAVMNISISGAVINIILNYVLIKQFGLGITGAATATFLAYFFINIANSLILYWQSGIHPITPRYIKPAIGSAVAGLAIYALVKNLPLYFWMLPIYLVMFVIGCVFFQFITRSIDREDIAMLNAISEKSGMEMRLVKELISRFARHS
jgi:O-antigen/teichoic acid export membrane protein